tara:strand:- start:11802 stop:15245 length:3444 start_codon:yes stop_codon:yes gene_type:complete
VAKEQQSIRDFSGGINRSSNKKNLQDNQLVESKNFISDSEGQLTTIQDEVVVSTNSFNDMLPNGNAKNIHAWSSDRGIILNQSPSNLGAPTITETKTAKRATIRFYFSSDFGSWSEDSRDLIIYNIDREEYILNYSNASKGGESWTSYNENLEMQGNTVLALETMANIKTTGTDSGIYTIPWAWKFYDPSSTDAVSYSDEADDADHLSDSTASMNLSDGANKFVVQKIVDEDFGADVANYPVWMMEMEFEYYGKINYNVEGSWPDNGGTTNYPSERKRKPSSGSVTIDSTEITWALYNGDITSTNSTINRNANTILWNGAGVSPVFGQFSKWLYGVTNISNAFQHDYTITIQVWTDISHTTHAEHILTYQNIQGETASDLINGLFGGSSSGEGIIDSDEIKDKNAVYWKITSDGVEIFQDERTTEPYGIKNITVTRANEVDFTDIQTAGDREANLVAVATDNSEATVYSLNDDQWTDWTIDMKIDSTVTTNNSDVSFFDSEGYLNVCDSSFRVNNKPQWFGYLSTDKTYLSADLMGENFTTTDLALTPHEELIDAGALAGGSLPSQWSHMALSPKDRVNLFTDTSSDMLMFGRSGAATDEDISKIAVKQVFHRKLGVEASGIKAYIEFLDGSSTLDTKNNTLGTFSKINSVELYFSYVYEGGYVSRPKRFQVDATTDSTNYQSTASQEDNRAMGIMVIIGRQLSGGTGGDNPSAYNERLKSVEIWAKYTETDPSNLYLICDINLNKGFRSNLSGDWFPLSSLTLNSDHHGYSTGALSDSGNDFEHYKRNNYLIFTSPNLIESFYQRYGLDYRDPIGFDVGGSGWKTACIFNRRAYYGNVHIRGKEDSLVYKPDGILKSVPGMYGTVGISNLVEATINDGDEIVSLNVVGNKLCQFKKHSLTIMALKILENGETREVIEQIIHHVGIKSENQVCLTPYGIFWVSRSGIYIYDGETLERLTENPKGSTLSKQEWETFYGSRLHCGYDAYWNQVLIPRDLTYNNETLIYSFNNKAFSSSNDLFNSRQKTGFAQTVDGHLLWGEEFNQPANVVNNCVTTSGSSEVSFPDNANVFAGRTVNGDGVPTNTTVSSVTVVADANDTFVMSNLATASATVPLTFGEGIKKNYKNIPKNKADGYTDTNQKSNNDAIE